MFNNNSIQHHPSLVVLYIKWAVKLSVRWNHLKHQNKIQIYTEIGNGLQFIISVCWSLWELTQYEILIECSVERVILLIMRSIATSHKITYFVQFHRNVVVAVIITDENLSLCLHSLGVRVTLHVLLTELCLVDWDILIFGNGDFLLHLNISIFGFVIIQTPDA